MDRDHQDHGIRINRFFTDQGIISRREADQAILMGRIKINGRRAVLGDTVYEGDQVSLDGRLVRPKAKDAILLAYHKPVGVECTTNTLVPANIIAAVAYPGRVFPIGRLDKDSEGLILLTNMGEIVNKILRAEHRHEKEYIVTVDRFISDQALKALEGGMRLSDGMTRPCKVRRENGFRVRMVLTEGKNRQIRRMMEALGLNVLRLKRVRIMNIALGSLPLGKWRRFSRADIASLTAKLES